MANERHFATLELKLVLIQFDTLCPAPVQEVLQVVVVILISLFVSVPLTDNEEVICDFVHPLETLKTLVKLLLETFRGGADPIWHAQPSVPSPCCLESSQLTRSVIQLNLEEPILKVSFGKYSRFRQLWKDVFNDW